MNDEDEYFDENLGPVYPTEYNDGDLESTDRE